RNFIFFPCLACLNNRFTRRQGVNPSTNNQRNKPRCCAAELTGGRPGYGQILSPRGRITCRADNGARLSSSRGHRGLKMKALIRIALAGAMLALAGFPALAGDDPSAAIAAAEKTGRAIFEHDRAAAVATDVAMAQRAFK